MCMSWGFFNLIWTQVLRARASALKHACADMPAQASHIVSLSIGIAKGRAGLSTLSVLPNKVQGATSARLLLAV